MRIPKKLGMSLLIGMGWIMAGLWLAHDPPDWIYHRTLATGVGCIGAGIFTFINYYRRRYALILTQEGFYNYTGVAEHGRQLVPWGLVGEISTEKSAQKIYVQLADVHTYKKNLTGCWAFMMQLHKDKDGLTIEISTTGMKLPPGVTRESLTQTMCDYRDKAQAS